MKFVLVACSPEARAILKHSWIGTSGIFIIFSEILQSLDMISFNGM